MGRPVEGEWSEAASLKPIAARLAELLDRDVLLATDWRHVAPLPGDVVLLENVRFNRGESADDEALAARLCVAVRRVCDGRLRYGASRTGFDTRRGAAGADSLRGPLLQAELDGVGAGTDRGQTADVGGRGRLQGVH